MTKAPLWKNLLTIEEEDSEEEYEDETFVHLNLSNELMKQNEILKQVDSKDSQKNCLQLQYHCSL